MEVLWWRRLWLGGGSKRVTAGGCSSAAEGGACKSGEESVGGLRTRLVKWDRAAQRRPSGGARL